MGKNFSMRPASQRLLGLAVLAVLAAVPAAAGWGHGPDLVPVRERRAATVARESEAAVDGVTVRESRGAASDLRRVESLGTALLAVAILMAGSVAIALPDRRRRPRDPVTLRTPARAPPRRAAFASAR
jgi:hypothetical protein